jgi:predicted DNA-binding ribbon-helix-helix protein
MRLEPELWVALEEICRREKTPIGEVVKRVEQLGIPGGRTSAVRVYVLRYFKDAATEAGHSGAGHGALQHDESIGETGWPANCRSTEPIAA